MLDPSIVLDEFQDQVISLSSPFMKPWKLFKCQMLLCQLHAVDLDTHWLLKWMKHFLFFRGFDGLLLIFRVPKGLGSKGRRAVGVFGCPISKERE